MSLVLHRFKVWHVLEKSSIVKLLVRTALWEENWAANIPVFIFGKKINHPFWEHSEMQ